MKNPPFPIDVATPPHQGELRADLTRDTFRPNAAFLRVLAQQGRPILDADLNEQTSILLRQLQTFIVDLVGPQFRARTGGFEIDFDDDRSDLSIAPGRFYAEGLACENHVEVTYLKQTFAPYYDADPPKPLFAPGSHYFVYLDAWERHVPANAFPLLREVALGGTDTASRSQVVWQVRIEKARLTNEAPAEWAFADLLDDLRRPARGRLRARVKDQQTAAPDPCLASPDAGYRGVENQLYRVEVDEVKVDPSGQDDKTEVHIKWSRENASVSFPVASIADNVVRLSARPRDARFSLQAKDWVELVDEHPAGAFLAQVREVDWEALEVTLELSETDPKPPPTLVTRAGTGNVTLRRWDQPARTVVLTPTAEDKPSEVWVELERGIEVRLSAIAVLPNVPALRQPIARRGDYWLIPARVASGDVEWPSADGKAAALAAHGVRHHYAPLAHVSSDAQRNLVVVDAQQYWPPVLAPGPKQTHPRPTPAPTPAPAPAPAPVPRP
ncbi:MAG: DUF6519 domain-containing protein [Polyangiales bacterium]